jgi:drug/metabolite transporter (DMT)-like permease
MSYAMNIALAIFCVILFSLTVPFTRIAALELAPELVALLRLFFGGIACVFVVSVDSWPRAIWLPLFLTSLCSVVGFGTLMAFALHQVPSSHGAIALAALPAVTAAYASFRDRHNPGFIFWLFAIVGTAASGSFFFTSAVTELAPGDLLLGLAVCAGVLGYVEGGRLSRAHGGRQVMSWAIVLSLPLSITGLIALPILNADANYAAQLKNLSGAAIFSIGYLALISQSIGMFLWYHALASGPMEKVAMTQLLQPFFSLLAAILLLNESVSPAAWSIALFVGLCVFCVNRAKTRPVVKLECKPLHVRQMSK